MSAPSNVLSSCAPAFRGLLVAAFLVLCWHYASDLNLWGDEAYSLGFVEGRIAFADPSHLPTYYALLKLLTSLVPSTNELALRMLHALAFALGLLFGATAVRRLTGSAAIALVSLGVAVLLPEFHFYATNLRMYSLVFLATMANVDAVSGLAEGDGTPSSTKLAWYVVSGAALVAIDFPGLFYFAIGAAYLAVKWLRARRWKLLPLLALPLLPLVGFFLANRPLITDLLRWDPEGDEAAFFASAFDFLQLTYLRFRPGLELVYAAPLPTSIALVLPPTLFAVILSCAFRQAAGVRGRPSAEPLIPLLALAWILLVPTGFTFTRLFLPSQFFMVVVLVRATRLPGKALRTAATAAVIVVVLVNLYQALIPTYRLDSVIPYRQIADDVAAISVAEGIETIMASNNSLNVESMRRYMNRHTDGGRIRFLAVDDAELARRATELNGRPFLFISHMGGRGAFIDIHQLPHGTPRLVRGYVPLRNLPYNDLWKRRYTERADQPDAIDVWIVR
ncbi:MAG: hypothetical protein ABI569_13095 [Casimicrobiaceae bacterium]